MYDKVDWWIRRSSSPEYQEAYDRIAGMTPVLTDQIILDVGCGNGEMIRRLYGRARKLVGSDISQGMLEVAAQNLTSNGVATEVFDRPLRRDEWVDEIKRDRVALYLDDIVNTTLPEEFFDLVELVFPDLRTNKPTDRMVQRLVSRIKRNPAYLENLEEVKDQELMLEAVRKGLKLVKQNGVFTLVIYGQQPHDISESQVINGYMNGFFEDFARLISHHYQLSPRIGSDTYDDSQGYRIFVVRKK